MLALEVLSQLMPRGIESKGNSSADLTQVAIEGGGILVVACRSAYV